MKRIVLSIIVVMLSLSSLCQNETGGSIRVSWDYCRFVYVYRGIPFLSSLEYNYYEFQQHKNTLYCNQLRKSFSVNGLSLSEQDYVKLNLTKREVDLDQCYYTEDYCGDSICQINLFANVKIPIMIDSIEFRKGDTIPIKEMQGKKLKFKKQQRFLRKNRILIETE
ncbi:MAG: hypothetical protein IKW82_08415 [Bacteroidales bacterium]|jgi:hypothetical protein|nr:hypothetical protein [Bacteroidales bacterium]